VPAYGALGMAIAVSVAVVATAWAAVAELRISDRLTPFGPGFWRASAAALAVIAILWLAGAALLPLGAPIRAIGLLALFWPLLWLGVRFGLDANDKAALGKLGRKLHL
jgi:hypothetical protein